MRGTSSVIGEAQILGAVSSIRAKGGCATAPAWIGSSLLLVTILLSLVSPASASTTYQYTGNWFTTFTAPYQFFNAVRLRMTFAAPLSANLVDAPVDPSLVSFRFVDGLQTITQLDADILAVSVSTDGTGAITSWEAYAHHPTGGFDIYSCNQVSCTDALVGGSIPTAIDAGRYSPSYGPGGDYADVRDAPGVWSSVQSGSYERVGGEIVDPILTYLGAVVSYSGPALEPFVDLAGLDMFAWDLSSADLTGANLAGTNLGLVRFDFADLSGANLTGAGFFMTNFGGADLTGATLVGVNGTIVGSPSAVPTGYGIRNGYFVGPGVSLAFADLSGADLGGFDLSDVDLTSANLSGANLAGVNLTNADLTDANLTGVHGQLAAAPAVLPPSYLTANNYIVGPGVDLMNADLTGADLDGVDLTGVDMTGANLTGVGGQLTGIPSALPVGYLTVNNYILGPDVNLANANLSNVDLTGVDLSGADLTGASLFGVSGQLAGAPSLLPVGFASANNYLIGPNVDLVGADLAGANLSGFDLTNVDLMNADLGGADLSGAILAGVHGRLAFPPSVLPAAYTVIDNFIIGPGVLVDNADLTGADLSGMDLSGSGFVNSLLTNADLTNADLTGCTFEMGDLTGVTLVNANLTDATVFSADLTNADLSGALMGGVTLAVTDLTGADMTGVDLSTAVLAGLGGQFAFAPSVLPTDYVVANNYIVGPAVDLTNADLSGTDLSGVALTQAILTDTNLMNATLTGADLQNLDLTSAILSGADLTDVDLSGSYLLGNDMTNVDLTGANLTNTYLDVDLGGAILQGVRGMLAAPPSVLPAGYVTGNNYIVGPGVDLTDAFLYGIVITFGQPAPPPPDLSQADLTGVSGQLAPIPPPVDYGPPFGVIQVYGPPTLPPGYALANDYIIGPGVDLTNVDLTGADLTGVSLAGVDLTGSDLTGATLFGVSGQLVGVPSLLPPGYVTVNGYIVGPWVDLTGADLNGADLTGVDFTGVSLIDANLAGANLSGVDLSVTLLQDVNLSNAILVGTNLAGAGVQEVNLSSADLTNSNWSNATLYLCDLTGANLTNSDWTGTAIFETDLSGVNLSGVDLSTSNMQGVSGQVAVLPDLLPANFVAINNYLAGPASGLGDADLSGEDLSGLDLTGWDMSTAILNGVTYDEFTVFPSGNPYDGPPWFLDLADTEPWNRDMVPVPEPDLLWSLTAGAVGLLVATRRRGDSSRFGTHERVRVETGSAR